MRRVIPLGRLVTIKSGYSPSTFKLDPDGPIPFVKVEDLNNCQKFQEGSRFYTHDAARSVPAGAVIFPKRGAAIMNNKVRITKRPICMDTNMMALIPSEQIDSDYLYRVILTEGLYKIADTSSIPQINNKHIYPYKISLPPLVEQRRIAEILSTWDRAIETVEALIANARTQKKALMQTLLTGKHRLPGFAGEWKVTTLEKLAKITMGSSPPSSAYNELGEGLPLIQGNADVRDRVSAPRIHTSVITQKCVPDDIIFSVRAPVGEIAKSLHHACIGRGVAAIQARSKSDAEFLYYVLLRAEPGWAALSQGSTFQAVNSKDLKGFTFPAPVDAAERQEIGYLVGDAQKAELVLLAQLTALRKEKNALMQQLLTGKRRVKVDEREAA